MVGEFKSKFRAEIEAANPINDPTKQMVWDDENMRWRIKYFHPLDHDYLAIQWQCGDCKRSYFTNSRKQHAKAVHKKSEIEITWLCLTAVNGVAPKIWPCEWCHFPFTSRKVAAYHEKNAHKKEVRLMESIKSEGYYWVDWSDAIKPVIRVYDEKGQGEPLTILEAKEQIKQVAAEAISFWHNVASGVNAITAEELENN